MINSLLERGKRSIILDKVYTKDNNNKDYLETEPEKVKNLVNEHFQNFAGIKHTDINKLNSKWKKQYNLIESINKDIYKELLSFLLFIE